MLKALLASLLVVTVPMGAPPAREYAEAAVEAQALDGERVTIPGRAARATVLVFVSHDCPISNQYAPEINRIAEAYAPHGVDTFLVYVDAELSPSAAREHAREFGYRCRAFLDPARRLVRFAGAAVTPEVAVFGPAGERLYRGRIDDRYPRPGLRRAHVTSPDLRNALEAILRGEPVPVPATTAVGCFIPAAP
jgi:hypothetical protein